MNTTLSAELRRERERQLLRIAAINVLLEDETDVEMIDVATPSVPEKVPKPRKPKALSAPKNRGGVAPTYDWPRAQRMFESGSSHAEIAKTLGIPLGQLYSKRSEQQWKKPGKTPKKKPEKSPALSNTTDCPRCKRELVNGTCSHCGYRGLSNL